MVGHKFRIVCAAALMAVSAYASQLKAAVVYQSLPDLTVQANTNGWCSSCGGNYRVYDTFTLSTASTLSQLTFAVTTGYNFPSTVTVGFYNLASGNTPGSQIASYDFTTSSFVSTVNTAYSTTLVTVNLPSLLLSAGSYDISFYNPSNLAVPGYTKSGGQLYQSGVGFHTDQVAAFSLSAGAASAVPEPATWGMMLVGFGALGGVLRRERRRDRLAV